MKEYDPKAVFITINGREIRGCDLEMIEICGNCGQVNMYLKSGEAVKFILKLVERYKNEN